MISREQSRRLPRLRKTAGAGLRRSEDPPSQAIPTLRATAATDPQVVSAKGTQITQAVAGV